MINSIQLLVIKLVEIQAFFSLKVQITRQKKSLKVQMDE